MAEVLHDHDVSLPATVGAKYVKIGSGDPTQSCCLRCNKHYCTCGWRISKIEKMHADAVDEAAHQHRKIDREYGTVEVAR